MGTLNFTGKLIGRTSKIEGWDDEEEVAALAAVYRQSDKLVKFSAGVWGNVYRKLHLC